MCDFRAVTERLERLSLEFRPWIHLTAEASRWSCWDTETLRAGKGADRFQTLKWSAGADLLAVHDLDGSQLWIPDPHSPTVWIKNHHQLSCWNYFSHQLLRSRVIRGLSGGWFSSELRNPNFETRFRFTFQENVTGKVRSFVVRFKNFKFGRFLKWSS